MRYVFQALGVCVAVFFSTEGIADCLYKNQAYGSGATETFPDGVKLCLGNSWEPVSSQKAVHIISSTWAAETGASCDATGAVRAMCQGKAECDVAPHNGICGPPDIAPHKQKWLIVDYQCGGGPKRTLRRNEHRDGSTYRLKCTPQ